MQQFFPGKILLFKTLWFLLLESGLPERILVRAILSVLYQTVIFIKTQLLQSVIVFCVCVPSVFPSKLSQAFWFFYQGQGYHFVSETCNLSAFVFLCSLQVFYLHFVTLTLAMRSIGSKKSAESKARSDQNDRRNWMDHRQKLLPESAVGVPS